MDIQYLCLIQVFLVLLFLIAIRFVSLHRDAGAYGCYTALQIEKCLYTYSQFSKHIERNKIYAYDKYQIWRYIERKRESSFI